MKQMTRIGMRGWLAVFPCVLAVSVGTTHADIIGYSVQGFGDGQLYSIDLVTGQTTAIGATGFDNVLGLAFQRSTG